MFKRVIGAEAADDFAFMPMLRRAVWPLAIKALPALYGAGLVLFVIRILPPAEFGKYGIAFAFVNLWAVIPRGMWIVPLVALSARGESNSVTGSVLWVGLMTAAIGGICALIVLPLLGVDGWAPLLAVIALLILVPRDIGFGLAQARGDYATGFKIDAAYFLGSLLLFGLLPFDARLQTADGVLVLNVISMFASALWAFKASPVLWQLPTLANWRVVAHQGRWIGLMGLGEIYMQQGDVLLVGAFVNAAELAPYIAARTLMRMYAIVSQAVNLVALPVASRLAAAGELVRLRRRLIAVLSTMLLLLIPINVIAYFASGAVFPAILGAKYIPAVPFFKILILATFFEPLYSILGNALAGMNRAKTVVVVLVLGVLINVIGNLICVPLFGIGVVPVITVCSYLVLAVSVVISANRLIR